MIFKKEQRGQSILEVIIAMAIFSLVAASLIGFIMGGDQALLQGGDQARAVSLAQEGIEAVRSIRDNAWNNLVYNQSAVNDSAGHWNFSGEGTTETFGKFIRTISFSDVCRNSLNQIVDCPGAYTDVQSKKIAVDVTWPVRFGITNSVQKIAYLTNWNSRDWAQTDWSGGHGQTIWSNSNMFDSSDGNINFNTPGQISLSQQGGGFSTTTWTFDTPADYAYDSQKIEVASSNAQLKIVSTVDSGGTTNSGFNTTVNPWVYNDWEGKKAAGSRLTSGGNPGPYINISIPFVRKDTSSGYWQQSFVTTVANPATATVSFDWRINSYSSSRLVSYIIYVFVDSTPGAPTLGTQVWSQTITGTTNWATVSNVDVSSKLATAGTYYLKIAARRITSNQNGSGTNIAGFDNVQLNWSGNMTSYSADNPTINPTTANSPSSVLYWSGFVESANKNGGEIYYQLSNDSGSTWQYWNGSSWVVAGITNYNPASVINANINKFATSSSDIMFKAFLSSDGTQQVQLDEVQIGYYGSGSGYQTAGYLISSAFNLTDNSPVQVIDWNETIPACTPVCNIKLQVRTAPDAGGSPGTWTDWYGASGIGAYFTNHYGELISKDLNNNRWVQYRAELTGDGVNTPILDEVRVNYK